MNASVSSTQLADDYRTLTTAAALVDVSDRSQVELAGADRAAFFHNFSTNEIRKLAPLAGCEAFVLTAQGKTLGHGVVYNEPERLVFETTAGQAPKLIAHLDRYLFAEKVTLADRSEQRAAWLLAGPAAAEVLAAAGAGEAPRDPAMTAPARIAGFDVWLRRTPLVGLGGFLVDGPREAFAAIGAALETAGARRVGFEACHPRRIEAGWPLYGVDITDKNLPQELARDATAISFIKGCYLGQETVARIDALGHVNRTLVGVRFAGVAPPEPGAELRRQGKAVGQVTSACFSPRLGAPLALAYVRREANAPGTKLDSDVGAGEVARLPIVD